MNLVAECTTMSAKLVGRTGRAMRVLSDQRKVVLMSDGRHGSDI